MSVPLRPLWIALLAAAFYGGWAAFSNSEYGVQVLWMAGVVQGAFAFAATLLLTLCVSYLLARQRRQQLQLTTYAGEAETETGALPFSCRLVVFLQSSFLLAVIPGGLHFFAGTPDIVQAMLPGLVIGNGYLLVLIRQQITTG